MLSAKKRAFLKKASNPIDVKYQIGKNIISENQLQLLQNALKARELIKVHILKTVETPLKDLAYEISISLEAEVVDIIGRVIILFKPRLKGSRFALPNG